MYSWKYRKQKDVTHQLLHKRLHDKNVAKHNLTSPISEQSSGQRVKTLFHNMNLAAASLTLLIQNKNYQQLWTLLLEIKVALISERRHIFTELSGVRNLFLPNYMYFTFTSFVKRKLEVGYSTLNITLFSSEFWIRTKQSFSQSAWFHVFFLITFIWLQHF